jgi:hypothetical protein
MNFTPGPKPINVRVFEQELDAAGYPDAERIAIWESLGGNLRLALGVASAREHEDYRTIEQVSTGEVGTQDRSFPDPALDRSRRPAKQ